MALIEDQQGQIFALATAAEERELELARLMERIVTGSAQAPTVETLHGVEEVRRWLSDQQERTTTEALAMSPGGGQSEAAMRAGLPLDEAALARGVRLRNLYLTSATRSAATRRHVRHLSDLGAEYRTTPSLPLRMLLLDGEVALLPIKADQTSLGALVVRTPAVLTGLRALFDTYWQGALPFGRVQQTADLTDQERLVVTMLADGAQDQEVATALGVSLRTVRRMVAALSDRLDSQSRFQTGVNAVRKGWLD
ncbi:helix-turn-helix, type 11 domain-containing [Nocardioides sp. CF8]|uniref:helix-turn-helix domain-containing protein n=1 Tax=Nocardioides sp. CF8 TaxID=110319 RepID=UPI00032EA709|nr:LuxR C-terminal-related transcriptional regulator [Nocardioides sp. CF8]EON25740.1 helix-turn-helix, type 11 domain-containing [Nocardioides sp. CF8]